MNKSESAYRMLATHVNDLRRLWFLEHEKNQKLKLKIQKFKQTMQIIQTNISINDSFVSDLNTSAAYSLDLSNQSTLEQTVNIRLVHQKIIASIIKVYTNTIKAAFGLIKSNSNILSVVPNSRNEGFGIKAYRIVIVLAQIGQKKSTILKINAFEKLKLMKVDTDKNKYASIYGMIRFCDRFQYKMKKVCVDRLKLDFDDFLYTNPLKNYDFTAVDEFCKSENNDELADYLGICMDTGNEANENENKRIGILKKIVTQRILRESFESMRDVPWYQYKLKAFSNALRNKVKSSLLDCLNELIWNFENKILHEEGAKILQITLSRAIHKRLKAKALRSIEIFSKNLLKSIKIALLLINSLFKCRKLRVFNSIKHLKPIVTQDISFCLKQQLSVFKFSLIYHNFQVKLLKSSFNQYIHTVFHTNSLKKFKISKKISPKLSNTSSSTILSDSFEHLPHDYQKTHLRRPFFNLLDYSEHKDSLGGLLSRLFKGFNHKLLLNYCKYFFQWKSSKRTKKSLAWKRLNNLQRLLKDQWLLQISLAFRTWQHKIYINPFNYIANKENYFVKNLDFESQSYGENFSVYRRKNARNQPLKQLKRN